MKTFRKKTARQVDARRVAIERMQRFNPLRNLTPDYLRQIHEEFNAGRLRGAARMWDAIERTDDMIKTVAPKRKKAVSRHGYEIIPVDESPAAKRHAKVLEFFYDNLIATRADDENQRGGLPLLIRNMMDAEGKKYAAHEIVWKNIDGGLTAEMYFTPLWYFENTTGRLRYLNGLSDISGIELNEAEWMIHTGEGIMEACAVAYMFKHLPLQDWLLYSQGYGRPIPKGVSNGAPGSAEWNAMEDAVAALQACDGIVVSQGSDIGAIDLTVKGELPYPPLVERMDRALAALWRGADLSTMSKGDGTGASVQGDETDMLEDDDADSITDTLNEQLDRFVILYTTGDTTPLAWIKIKTGLREDTQGDLAVDKGLYETGWQQPAEELEKRYGRNGLTPKPEAIASPFANENRQPNRQSKIDNRQSEDALLASARSVMAKAIAEDMKPVADRLAQILDDTPDGELFSALEKFRSDELPELAKKALSGTAGADALEQSMVAALFNGIEQGSGVRDQESATGGKKA